MLQYRVIIIMILYEVQHYYVYHSLMNIL